MTTLTDVKEQALMLYRSLSKEQQIKVCRLLFLMQGTEKAEGERQETEVE